MNAALHARAKALFAEACRHPEPERASFVRAAAAGDDQLVAEVESLLRFHDGGPPPGEMGRGQLYAGRYRVVELIGRGGIGEVFRADDTLLDVTVALKRVRRPGGCSSKEVLTEARLAREVTHRAVCRVFDVGEAEAGEYYLTMEYVDGEDLASLVRRIGRLPAAKVAQIGRQLAAGLAAAHARGILHRDIKPANIMIDRGGNVRITDFGIAVMAGGAPGHPAAGTPAYMAPELLSGGTASPQSDLYSVGLVLYEIVTGRYPFLDEREGPATASRRRPMPPSALASDVPLELDRAIQQALEPLAADRPSSAIAFSAALPGGDSLQAALEAGVTPSPEAVASAGSAGQLAPRSALACLAAAAIGLIVIVACPRARLIDQVPFEEPPAVLEAQVRAFVREVTGSPQPSHRVAGVQSRAAYLRHIARHPDASVDPAQVGQFLYRESPEPMVPALRIDADPRPSFAVSADTPPLTRPGMVAVMLDARGRLRWFRAVPDTGPGPAAAAVDWSRFFRASGIDTADMVQVQPQWSAAAPTPFGQERFAWRAHSVGSSEPLRIEAAASANRPTLYEVKGSWMNDPPDKAPSPTVAIASGLFGLALALVSCGLAWRNLRGGRGDRRGARRLALAYFIGIMSAWVLRADFLPVEMELGRLFIAAALALAIAASSGVLYLALEPFVRRRWPSSLIAWSRLLAGKVADARVGRDVLIGGVVAIISTVPVALVQTIDPELLANRPDTVAVETFMGARHLVSQVLSMGLFAVTWGMTVTFLFTIMVGLVRDSRLAGLALVAFITALSLLESRLTPLELVAWLTMQALWVVVIVRFGLLCLVSYLLVEAMLSSLPLSFGSAWRAELSTVTLLALVAMLGLAAYVAVARAAHTRAAP